MTDRAQELLREALALPPGDRANVTAELLASLDDLDAEDPAAVQAAWAEEMEGTECSGGTRRGASARETSPCSSG